MPDDDDSRLLPDGNRETRSSNYLVHDSRSHGIVGVKCGISIAVFSRRVAVIALRGRGKSVDRHVPAKNCTQVAAADRQETR